jgi:hypothetical protein
MKDDDMRSRIARPDTETLPISNGDTLIVKRRLNYGDARKMRSMQEHATLREAALVMAYLVDWSLTGLDGERISIAGLSPTDLLNRLDALSDDAFDEIYAAIQRHVAAMQAERDTEKNGRDGGSGEPAISPSPSGVAGASSGSVN